MIPEAHDEKRLGRKVPLEAVEQRGIVARAQALPPDIFIDARLVSGTAPVRGQFRTETKIPGKMIGGGIDEQEKRPFAALARDDLRSLVEVKAVGFETAGAQILHVKIALDPGRGLEIARAEKSAVERIQAERLIAASAERMRQPARYPPARNARYRRGKTAVGACRQPGEYVVFSEPARTAGAFDHELPRGTVERLEVLVIARRDLDTGRGSNVEA